MNGLARWKPLSLVVSIAALLALAAPAAASDKLYWADYGASATPFGAGAIRSMNLDGGAVTAVYSQTQPAGLALDPAGGRMFWGTVVGGVTNGQSIHQGALDGSSAESMLVANANAFFGGVAFDATAGRVYWADYYGDLMAQNADGTGGVQTLFSLDNPEGPGLALDPAAGKIYWANSTDIDVENLDGTGFKNLYQEGNNATNGVAVDPLHGKIYWANLGTRTIRVGDVSGTGAAQTLYSTGSRDSIGVAVDPYAGKIYWTSEVGIKVASLDGSTTTPTTLLTSNVAGDSPAILRAPAGTGAPAITGSPALSCSQGSWGGDLPMAQFYTAPQSFSYQWALDGTDIDGATSSTYTATVTGSYTCRVTAANLAGSSSQTSAPVAVDVTAPTTTIALDPASPNGQAGWYTSAVGVTVSASDPDDAVAATDCVLDPLTPPTAFSDFPSGCSYTTKTSVTSDGQHTLYAASEDSNGNDETPVSASFEIDATAPTVSFSDCPTSSDVFLGNSVTAHWAASDAAPGSGLATASSGSLALATVSTGAQSVNAPTATDVAGNASATTSCSYTVQTFVVGYVAPLAGSSYRAGSSVPVKVALTDAAGKRISNTEASMLASACRVKFSAAGAQKLAAQCMAYDAKNQQFTYAWKLAKTGTGNETLTTSVGYPNTTTTTTKSESIKITSK